MELLKVQLNFSKELFEHKLIKIRTVEPRVPVAFSLYLSNMCRKMGLSAITYRNICVICDVGQCKNLARREILALVTIKMGQSVSHAVRLTSCHNIIALIINTTKMLQKLKNYSRAFCGSNLKTIFRVKSSNLPKERQTSPISSFDSS